MSARILVTGAGGFVGLPLCELLLELGGSLRAVVRSPNVQLEELATASSGRLEIVHASIEGAADWPALLAGIDRVAHLAALVHMESGPSLEAYRAVNVAGTERLALAAARSGVRRFVFLSTAKVFGEQSADHELTEADPPRPQDAYAISKWEAEQALNRIAADTGIEVAILRPPLVYGPGVKANFLRLIDTVARGLPLPLASVNNRRSLLGVRNLVDALTCCLDDPRAAGETFVVADPVSISTPDLIREIAAALHVPARLFPCPVRVLRALASRTGRGPAVERLVGDLVVDAGKLSRTLGWTAPIPRAVGFASAAAWYRERVRARQEHYLAR